MLNSQLEAHGYQSRIVSIQRLHDLSQAIERIREQGLFDDEFYEERLTGFSFGPPK